MTERRYRWVPGMMCMGEESDGLSLVVDVTTDGRPCVTDEQGFDGIVNPHYIEPARSEPGTVGHLAAQAREAWGRPHLHAQAGTVAFLEEWREDAGHVRWFIRDGVDALPEAIRRLAPAETEGDAWLACLAAAPRLAVIGGGS